MNIFTIPSWYPSYDHPITGIFCKEQVKYLAELYPEIKFCISLWGQNEESNLLTAKGHIYSLGKLWRMKNKMPYQTRLSDNLFEYYNPAVTWSRKIMMGNIRKIIKSNETNFIDFEKKHGKVDIIHAHVSYPAGFIAMALAGKFNVPYIITEHMSPFPFKYFMYGNRISNCITQPLANASTVIAVSPDLMEKIKNIGINHVEYIPNMVDENAFKIKENQSLSENFIFFTLGRMVEQKGIPVLLKAIKYLKNDRVKFRIGGDGENLRKYKKMAKFLGIDDKITWLGELNREKVKFEFQRSHTFVLPSLHENFPLVLLEAIACGKSIIVTRCGGPESIVNETNGLLVNINDSIDLAQKMKWVSENYRCYDKHEIRKDFLSRFSRPVVAKKILDVYSAVYL